MKRILVGLATAAATLGFASSAMASVDSNIVASIRNIEWGAPKWITVNGYHTSNTGTFTGEVCSAQWVAGSSVTYLSRPIVFDITYGSYTNNGNTVHINTVTWTRATC